MSREIEDFLATTVRCLIEGDMSFFLNALRVPMPMFHPDGIEVLASETDLRDAGEELMAYYRSLKIKDVRPKLLDTASKPTLETTGYLMEFRYLDGDGAEVRKTIAWYFLEPFGDSYRIVMTDFRQPAIPEFFSEFRKVIPLRPLED